VVDERAGWQLLATAHNDPRHRYLAARGMLHLQLFHAGQELSLLTPSPLTAGRYELWRAGERTRVCCFGAAARHLAALGASPPCAGWLAFHQRALLLPASLAGLVGRARAVGGSYGVSTPPT
jgi:hypothetical protein